MPFLTEETRQMLKTTPMTEHNHTATTLLLIAPVIRETRGRINGQNISKLKLKMLAGVLQASFNV